MTLGSVLSADAETAVPATRRGMRPTFVWAFVAFLATNMFSGHTHSLHLPIGPDRLFFAAAAVLFVLDRRYPLRELRLGSVHVIAAIVIAIAGLSAFSHGILTQSYAYFALLDRLVIPYVIFTAAPLAFRRSEDRLLIIKTLTLVGIYLGLMAMFEILGPHSLVYPRYILDPSLGAQFGRARGPFVESEANGLTMLACLWCAITLVRVASHWAWRWVAVLSAVMASVGALLTLTRSIWLGGIVGVVAVLVFDRRLRRALGVTVAVAAIVGGLVVASSQTLSGKVTGRAEDQHSIYDRQNTDAAAIRAIEDHPLTGVGWLQFIFVSGDYVRQSPNYPMTVTDIEVHNVVLSRMVEIGVPGGALWVMSVMLGPGLAALRRPSTPGQRTWRLILIGTAAGWATAVMASPVPYPMPNTLVWLFAGLALGPALLRSPDLTSTAPY